ncbi:MAG: ABC transporter permease [Mariprofundaceae bacterium]
MSIYQQTDAHAVHLLETFCQPSQMHLLGCDALGRDVLARLGDALQLSISVGLIVITICAVVGITLGLFAGWVGGWPDALLMRFTDIVLSFPGILLAIALAAVLGPGIDKLVIALSAVGWTGFARLARSQTLSIKSAAYVEASCAVGSRFSYTAVRHLLPNISAPLLIEASFGMAAVIIGEAGLSFLGIGVQPPEASLGSMIREGTRMMLTSPLLVIWPGMMLFCIVMAVNLLGDHLRGKLDVRDAS